MFPPVSRSLPGAIVSPSHLPGGAAYADVRGNGHLRWGMVQAECHGESSFI